jgi:hypothetical protein
MHGSRRLIGIGTAALLAVAAAAPGTATARQKYRYKFSQAVRMDWQWPVNPNNRGRRDTQAFEVMRGSGCGTAPGHAVWKITYRIPDSGLPSMTLKVDLIRKPKNPAKIIDNRYPGTPMADVQGYMKFGLTKVTLTGVPHGDVLGPTYTARTAPISKRKVARC